MEALKSGDQLGRYRLDRPLGAGGMGSVWVAVQEGLGRRVALKVMHPAFATDAGIAGRFRREAEIAASFNHPGIVPVTDFGVHEGQPYLVMDLLEGESMDALLAREGQLSAERVAFLATQVLSALEAAHAKDIIHRDLKPDNVFVTSSSGVQDVARLLDFGIASLVAATGDAKMTSTGQVLGTPAYMAPEQAKGLPVEPRSDLYSVGVIMYEALTGQVPFAGTNYHQLMFAIVDEAPPPLGELRPDLDPAFVGIVERAMSKKAEDRYENAAAMRAAIAPFARSMPMTATSADSVQPVQATPTPSGTDPLAATMASGDQLTPVAASMESAGSSMPRAFFVVIGVGAALALLAGAFVALRADPPMAPLASTASDPTTAAHPSDPGNLMGPANQMDPANLPEAADPLAPVDSANAGDPVDPVDEVNPSEGEGQDPVDEAVGEDSINDSSDGVETTMRRPRRTGAPPNMTTVSPAPRANMAAQRSGPVMVPCGSDGGLEATFYVEPGVHDLRYSGGTNDRVRPREAYGERARALNTPLTECFANHHILRGLLFFADLGADGRVVSARMSRFCPIPPAAERCALGVIRTLDFGDLEHLPGEIRLSYSQTGR